jgi:predicted CopG family antitoxin
MKKQVGEVVTGDLQENTITIEIDGDMELQAGKVAVISVEELQQLEKKEQQFSKFLQNYMRLRKRQHQFFKTKNQDALKFCKEVEPQLDQRAIDLYQSITQPQLFQP